MDFLQHCTWRVAQLVYMCTPMYYVDHSVYCFPPLVQTIGLGNVSTYPLFAGFRHTYVRRLSLGAAHGFTWKHPVDAYIWNRMLADILTSLATGQFSSRVA